MCTWDTALTQDNSDYRDSDDKIGFIGGLTNQHTVIYGPEPCKPITRLTQIGDLVIFKGGMPRASYGDRFAITGKV